jgi:hypothetical protein
MKKTLLLLTLGLGLSLQACGAIDAAVDCNTICNRYKTCFDGNYDVAACTSRCRSTSSTDPDYRRKADTCTACITDRACASATFNCGTDCAAVVP